MVEREQSDPGAIYYQEAGKAPLLTREEEVELATQYKLGKKAGVRLKESENDGLRPEKREELEFLIAQGERARDRFVASNLRLVISIARQKLGQGVPLPDLIQEGNIGLLKAIERFNPDRGFKLSTYAIWWIRQAVGRAVAEQGRTIRIPGHASEELSRFRRKTIELTARFGREPTLEELAKELGWSRQRAERVTGIPIIACSLDEPVGVEEDSYLGEFIKDVDTFPPSEAATEEILGEQLRKAVDSLKPREAEVLSLRFGLVDGDPRTLSEVAEEFNLSRERIRQIQAEALRKLRHPSRTRGLRDYLEKG